MQIKITEYFTVNLHQFLLTNRDSLFGSNRVAPGRPCSQIDAQL